MKDYNNNNDNNQLENELLKQLWKNNILCTRMGYVPVSNKSTGWFDNLIKFFKKKKK